MAHFAKLKVGNIVETVVVVHNDVATSEQVGIDFLNNLYGTRDFWVQTSYNGNFRKNFAGVGFKYDDVKDAFIAPQPFPSWTLNSNDEWEAPVTEPAVEEEKIHIWNEENQNWEAQ